MEYNIVTSIIYYILNRSYSGETAVSSYIVFLILLKP
jgi:hypothetical protein